MRKFCFQERKKKLHTVHSLLLYFFAQIFVVHFYNIGSGTYTSTHTQIEREQKEKRRKKTFKKYNLERIPF